MCVTKLLMTPEFNGPSNVRHFIMHCAVLLRLIVAGYRVTPFNERFRSIVVKFAFQLAELWIAIDLYTLTSYTVLAPILIQHKRCHEIGIFRKKFDQFCFSNRRIKY